ncbi:MAG: hypothetical protein GKR95_24565 [Gammaproteobacteria bacterium]|nr:hypothetical protein [Gammaproteobacteria bacterium]
MMSGSVKTNQSEPKTIGITFEGKILDVVQKSAHRIYLPVLIVNMFIAILVMDNVKTVWWVSWAVLMAITSLSRRFAIDFVVNADRTSETEKLRYVQYIMAFSGVAHGLSSLFFPYIEIYERSVITMIMAGLCLGNIFTNAGYRPMFLSYLIPIMLPISIMWIFGWEGFPGWSEYSVSIIVLLYSGILLTFAKDVFETFKESYEIRSEQLKINKKLEKALVNEEFANAAKTRFLASASHDLRQPLNSLAVYSAALNFQKLDTKSTEIVSCINQSQEILSNQLRSLFDISKLDSGTVVIEQLDFSLRNLLTHAITGQMPLALSKEIEIVLEQKDDIVVTTDKYQFERIISRP